MTLMSDSNKAYERLTRPRFGMNGLGSLWLGKDHVLLVNNAFAVERYRRWYYRDIQAVVLRRTSFRMMWNIILGVVAFMLLSAAGASLYGSSTSTSSEDITILSVMAAVFGFMAFAMIGVAAVNTSMGPSCTAFIQTPHGLDRLSTPNRVPAVEKLNARLWPALVVAQRQEGSQTEGLRDIAAALDQPLS